MILFLVPATGIEPMARYRGRHRAHHTAGRHARLRHWWLRGTQALGALLTVAAAALTLAGATMAGSVLGLAAAVALAPSALLGG
jgi:hypothetical protein